jgi:2-C-methyl-D-erythritol 4-phosphate cytidylyltransferase
VSAPVAEPRNGPPGYGLWALVPAAGAGIRMAADRPKQYLPLLGRPLLQFTLERIASFTHVRGLVVGLAEDDPYWPTLPKPAKLVGSYIGGAQRAETVLNGLKVLMRHAAEGDWVLVHDAVRPCVRHGDIERLIRGVGRHPDGGLLALPVADTVKRADRDNEVIETIPREGLWRAVTPQLFPIGMLKTALEKALRDNLTITDEAMAIEHLGGHPKLVASHGDNIKITLPGDLELAELYLKQQSRERE